jgi:hypothetical protein
MKFTPTIKMLIWGLGLLPLFVLTQNCGAQRFDAAKSDVGDLGSTEPIPNDGSKPTAMCSTDVANQSDLKVKAGVVYNSLGQVNTTKIRFKLVNIPEAMIEDGWDMKVFDWGADPDGNRTDYSERRFQFERKVNNGFEIVFPSNNYAVINTEEMVQMGAALSLTLTPRQALEYFTFQVDLGPGTRQALQLRFYKSNGEYIQSIDVLMPVFYANPSDYAVGKPQDLIDLHPLKERVGQTWTFSQWQEFFQNMCF